MSLGLFSDSGNLDLLKKVRNFLSQKELAARLHYTPRQIARWEKGESPLPHALLPALREILQIEEQKDCDFTFIDLFAGIGGIRLGFEANGGKCIFTSEWDSYARKSYLSLIHI